MPDIDNDSEPSLPRFRRTRRQLEHVARHRATARIIRSLWIAASVAQRKDPDFLVLLVKLGWNNRSKGRGFESTREWRSEQLAEYLHFEGAADDLIAERLGLEFPSFKKKAYHFLQQYTGIAHYHRPWRTTTLEFVRRHHKPIGAAFRTVSAGATEKTIRQVVDALCDFTIEMPWALSVPPLPGLTPTLACLDPHERFPIMNKTTRPLLRALGQTDNSEGAVALYRLIGSRDLDIKSSFELDVYAVTQSAEIMKRRTRQSLLE